MLKKDNVVIGLAMGFLIPSILYGLTIWLFKLQGLYFDTSFYEGYSLFMIGLNGIIMRYVTVNKEKDNIGKGIIIATLILAIAWVVKYQT